eukprot:XP_001691867.1 Paf1 complex component [Chlamydomonas reinhardtii]
MSLQAARQATAAALRALEAAYRALVEEQSCIAVEGPGPDCLPGAGSGGPGEANGGGGRGAVGQGALRLVESLVAASKTLQVSLPVVGADIAYAGAPAKRRRGVLGLLDAAERAARAGGGLAHGRLDAFDHIYETATSEETAVEVERYFGQKPTYERIQFFTARAAILIAQFRDEKQADAKALLLSEAKKLITTASSLDPNEQLVLLTSGLHHMARGDLTQAARDWERAASAKNNGRPNVVGHLALAGLHYQQQHYKKALQHYRTALREFPGPGCPAEVRLGIAAASFKLGDLATAKAAYKRVLALDPDCADAYLGLALLAASDANVQQGLADCLRHLLTAYQLQPGHVGVLTHLAHYCLLMGQPERGEVLARAALEGAEALPGSASEGVRAEAMTLLARAYHAQGRMDEARAEYGRACALDKRSPLPRLGMAQMYCGAGQLINAATELEEALKAAPAFYDALKEATGKQPGDAELWEMLGELLAPSDPADEDVPLPDHVVPTRLLNNAAVLHYRAGEVATALALLQRAAGGEYKAAAALYKEVLSEHPTYIDCYLRLACIARAKGNHKEALEFAQSALDKEGGHADALALMSQLYMERRDYEAAGKTLIQLIQDSGSKRDTYGRIGYANTYLYTAPKDRKEDQLRKAEARFSKALDEYRAVLDADPRNVWAANGCGAALAELGYLDAAQSVFSEVYASMALSDGFLTIPDVLINLANCNLARCDYQDAVHLYRTALDKLEHKHHPQVLLYLARALYDSNKLTEAQSCLKRAIHLAPTDYKLRFNYALTLQEWAVRTFRKERVAGDPTKLPDFQRAEVLLKEAHRHYEHLKVLGRERSGLDDVKLNAHVSFCAAQLQKTQDLIDAAAKEDYEARLRRHEQIKIREAAEADRQAEELRRQAEVDEARRRRDELARAAQDKWAGDKGGRKSAGRDEVGDLFGDDEEEAAPGTEQGDDEPEYDEDLHRDLFGDEDDD